MRIARSNKQIEGLAMRMFNSEEEAYIEFAEIFGPRLRAFFVRRGLSIDNAEDLSVSCVTDISLKIHKYTPVREGGFTSWVFALANNSLMDWWRSHHATEQLPENLAAPFQPDGEFEPETTTVLAVREALSVLPDADRAIIRLRDLGETYTYEEIGERLGISVEAARVRHHRALKKLRAVLQKDPRITHFLSRQKNREQEIV